MGKRRLKEKRIRKVAESALQSEIARNAQKVPEIIPESSLFEEDNSNQPEKKKKIVLHPRPSNKPRPKTADEEIEDIWGPSKDIPIGHPKPRAKPKQARKAKNYPTSAMAYNSAKIVTPKKEEVEEEGDNNDNDDYEHDAAELENDGVEDTGLGDSVKGDAAVDIQVNERPPDPVKVLKKDVLFDGKVTKSMPDNIKMQKHQAKREAERKIREIIEEKMLPEFDKVPQYSEEIRKRNEEIAARPKKEKEDKLMKFVADEPEFQVHEKVNSLAEMPGDVRAFSRIQRKFEVERKTALHESKI